MNKCRRLVFALGIGALAAPLVSYAQQQGKVWRVGFLSYRHVDFVDTDYYYGPFTQGMRELGYIVGKNLLIEWRSAEGKAERLPELAAELLQLKMDVLITPGQPVARVAQKATNTVPIVLVNVGDPVADGLVKSLARPGGNSTGLTNMAADLAPKLLEMLREISPKVSRVAVLVNASNVATTSMLKDIQGAAQKLGVTIQSVEANTPQAITSGFTAMARQKAEALIVTLDALFIQEKGQIVGLAAKQRLPAIFGHSGYVEAGGLISYGQNLGDNYRRAAIYVDKIFKGAKPGELPIEQPMKFELVINMKTAKALGLTMPPTIMLRATRVIE